MKNSIKPNLLDLDHVPNVFINKNELDLNSFSKEKIESQTVLL
jgi:hypothetical protein